MQRLTYLLGQTPNRLAGLSCVQEREVQLTTEINNLMRQLLDIIDKRRSFIGELEQRLLTIVMAYKTRQELKCHQKDDMIRAMEMRSTALQLHHQAMKGFHFYKYLIIPGPVGIVQTSKLRKLVNTQEGGEESLMSTQEYIRKVIEDVGEDDDFTRASWLSAIDYVNVDRGIVTGCFRDVKKFLKNGKLEQIVAVIKSYTPNALGDLTVTLKDLSGTIFGTIH
nr:hypothetical protein [Tanacetum cinerariifolium]